jgi:DNA-binding transcriptional LysR family regulator
MNPQGVDRLKLRQLRVLLAITEHGSVTRAAEHLFVTQAAVSKAVAEIEVLIGTPLFERQGRGIAPTEAGHLAVRAARRVVTEMKALADDLELLADGGAGTLVVGLQAVSVAGLLPRILGAMTTHYPRVTIRLIEGTLPNVLRDLRAGRVDLAIGRMMPRLLGDDLDGLSLPTKPYIVVASPGHRLLAAPDPSWDEACRETWCLPLPGTPVRDYFADFLAGEHLSLPAHIIEVGSATLIATMFGSVPMLALAPANLAAEWAKSGLCEPAPLALPLRMEPIGLIWSRVLPLKPCARLFHAEALALLSAPAEE